MTQEELIKRATMLSALETVMEPADWHKYHGMALVVVQGWEVEDTRTQDLTDLVLSGVVK